VRLAILPRVGAALLATSIVAAPTAAAPAAQVPTVAIDGSSTVFPVTEAMAEEYQRSTGGRVRVTVGVSGTGGGFQKFCNGELDVADASRPISSSEITACKGKEIGFVELPVGFDGLSIVVSQSNTWVDSMTVSELKMMWEPAAQGTITNWNQIRPEWPDAPLNLYGPGADSGTFDYFTEVINGTARASRGDFTASEDDNVLVQGVAGDPNALGYFGFAYYEENQDRLKLIAIDPEDGRGPIYPAPDTIAGGQYVPLSRPIFIYAKQSALQREEVMDFLEFYLTPLVATTLIPEVGYVAFPEEYYTVARGRLETQQTGTVFGGTSRRGVTVDDLFIPTPSMP
jgi:phosphate transport system substrate-binding protein